MAQAKPFYSVIAQAFEAYTRCADNYRKEKEGSDEAKRWWDVTQIHVERINQLVAKHAPSGSGFDAGTHLDWDRTSAARLVFSTSFHHMSEHGYYDGWTEHKVCVRPSLAFGFTINVTGRDRNQIKEFISDIFYNFLEVAVE